MLYCSMLPGHPALSLAGPTPSPGGLATEASAVAKGRLVDFNLGFRVQGSDFVIWP